MVKTLPRSVSLLKITVIVLPLLLKIADSIIGVGGSALASRYLILLPFIVIMMMIMMMMMMMVVVMMVMIMMVMMMMVVVMMMMMMVMMMMMMIPVAIPPASMKSLFVNDG